MAQFDVYVNENRETQTFIPFFVDVQSEVLASLNTRMVIPLANDITGLAKLNPEFIIENQKVILLTQDMVSVPIDRLRRSVDTLLGQRDEIIRAIDFMLVGF
jgi:toxin CcdB